MSDITLDRLRKNFTEHHLVGSTLMVSFVCPLSGRIVHAVAPVRPAGVTPPPAAPRELRRTGKIGLQTQLKGIFVPVELPAGGATSIAPRADAPEIQAAILEAFDAVSHQFSWSEQHGAYVDAALAVELLTDFDRRLKLKPLTNEWDRHVALRIMAEVGQADGELKPGERDLLQSFVQDESQDLNAILAMPELTKAELERVSDDAPETILMLAYAIAMSDQDLSAREKQKLTHYAALLGIGSAKEAAAKLAAAEKLVESIIAGCLADGVFSDQDRASLLQEATGLGLGGDEIATIEKKYCRRRGLV